MTSREIKKALTQVLQNRPQSISVESQDFRVGERTLKLIIVDLRGHDFPGWLRALSLQHLNHPEVVTFTKITLFKEHWEEVIGSSEFLSMLIHTVDEGGNLHQATTTRAIRPGDISNGIEFSRYEGASFGAATPFDLDEQAVGPEQANPLNNLINNIRRGRPSVYTQCIRCQERLRKTDCIPVTMEAYACSNCIEYFQSCRSCTRYFLTSMEGVTTINDHFYCRDCSQSLTWRCTACDECFEIDRNVGLRIRNHIYCEDCRSDNIFTCNECGDLEENSSRFGCQTCGNYFCHSCQREHRSECGYRELIEPYQFMEGKKENSILPFSRFVGVEIEAEKGELSKISKKLPAYVGIVRDGSLHDRGVEIVTPPANYDILENIVGEVTTVLKANGFKGTSNCGLHLHYDARDIMKDHRKIIQVIKTFFAMEDLLYSMLPPSRWVPEDGRKNYCQRLSEDYLFKNFRKQVNKNDFEKDWYKVTTMRQVQNRKSHKYDESRYYGLNIHSIFYRGTIELRYHSGTIEEKKIINWIDITSRMVNYAIHRYDEKEVAWFFNQETGYEKFKKFTHLMGMNNRLAEYMMNRINKFNPDFGVKFNLGKEKRAMERRAIALKRKKVEGMILKSYPEALKKIKAEFGLRGETESRMRIKQHALMLAREMARNKMSRDLFNLPVDGGFIKKEDLNMIKFYMDRGIQLAGDKGEGADEAGL